MSSGYERLKDVESSDLQNKVPTKINDSHDHSPN